MTLDDLLAIALESSDKGAAIGALDRTRWPVELAEAAVAIVRAAASEDDAMARALLEAGEHLFGADGFELERRRADRARGGRRV